MADYLWPVDIVPASQSWRVVDPAAVYQSPLTGAVRTVARSGARMGCTITLPPMNGADRARVMSVLTGLRGKSNRIWMPDFSTTRRGSFSAPELITNGDFSNGTTGWTAGGGMSLSVVDRAIRATRTSVGTVGNPFTPTSAVTATQYAPHAVRYAISGVSPDFTTGHMPTYSGVANLGTLAAQNSGVFLGAIVRAETSLYPTIALFDSDKQAGSYIDISWLSHARCALVDNGPNALLQSDAFNTTWTPTRATVSVNPATAPDGTVTADALNEDGTASNTHSIAQSVSVASTAADFTFSVCILAGNRTWAMVTMTEGSGGTEAGASFNLSAGTIGTVFNGASMTNCRAFITALGNGWFNCTIVARKTNSATSITPQVFAATADNTRSYSGSSFVSLYLWRGSFAQSSVPVRGTQTTTASTTGTSQTGSRLYLKGLPASTSGLLRVGDPVQIGNQINFVTAPLDSNAAGLGVLQCGIPWRVSPADNDPVIINRPMAKMILASDDISWETGPGQFSSFSLELIEDVT